MRRWGVRALRCRGNLVAPIFPLHPTRAPGIRQSKCVRFPSVVELAVLTGGLLVGCAASLVSSARPRRPGRLLFSAGVGIATASTVVGIAAVLMAGRSSGPALWLDYTAVVEVGITVSVLLLGAGLLHLPGVADSRPAALRLALDGVALAAALWLVGYVLLVEPTRLFGETTPAADPTTMSSAAAAALAIGVTCAVAIWCPRTGLGRAGFGVGLTAVGGLALIVGLNRVGPDVALVGAVELSTGLLLLMMGNRRADEPGPTAPDPVNRGIGYTFLPMVAMTLATTYHLLADGRLTALGVLAWIIEGFALAIRQYLALRDVRGFAERLAQREAHFRELAHTDPLTGLANRRGLLLAREGAPESGCVLLVLDLDGFKNINDMRGHAAGDLVLREVGARLSANVRSGDVVARLGGDEFAILMRSATVTEAKRVAERLRGALSRPYPHPAGPIVLSASVGLADCAGSEEMATLLRHADLALRFAKQQGKNRVEQYDSSYEEWLHRRIRLEHDLRNAAARGELHLVFQPVVALPSARPVGAEALLRWQHPTLGKIPPDEFIPLAEECGLIDDLGAWVLDQACHQLARWLAAGHDVWVSVNVSPRELHAPQYVSRVAETLRVSGVPPQRLVLEVTEHAVATDIAELIRRLRGLRGIGVRIALDDFGAGYSSLGQLRKLPIDILKIDHSLVTDREPAEPGRDGVRGASMVDVVAQLGHQLGLQVIAEGVGNQPEFSAVVGAGCRFGQGRLFGWGVPAEHLTAMLSAAAPLSPRAGGLTAPRQVALPATGTRTGAASVIFDAQHVGAVDSAHEMRQA